MSTIKGSFHPTNLQYFGGVETSGTLEGLMDALIIWINKPHVVNRRLCGSRIKFFKHLREITELKLCIENILHDIGYSRSHLTQTPLFLENGCDKICKEFKENGQNQLDSESASSDVSREDKNLCDSDKVTQRLAKMFDVLNKLEECDINIDLQISTKTNDRTKHNTSTIDDHRNVSEVDSYTQDEISGLCCVEDENVALIVRELLPKQPERHRNIPELVVFDKDRESCTFYPLLPSNSDVTDHGEVVYEFLFHSGKVNRIELYVSDCDQTRDSDRKLSLTWLKDVLLKKLARWSETPNLKTSLTSLILVPVDEYSRLYSELKNKYGLYFAKIWPENTDPQKFVFEDVSIATYLLLLWQQDREKKQITKKQSFIDLGCGNGLLVHILASEGHPGYGVDIRRRKIWDMYGPETILKESTVTPSSECLFPDCDWLIGNHSDELTPWIPVMAARSSYTCNYFVLPCCHYDFNAKFSYDPEFGQQTEGQYQCYLNYVRHIGEKCGFHVEEDVLRIPSTKRVCFIGRSRFYEQSCEDEIDQSRQEFIEWRCNKYSACDTYKYKTAAPHNSTDDQWVQTFIPRDKVESIRNCVTISNCVKQKVIGTVFEKLLNSDDCEIKIGHDGKSWRKGGQLPISQVSELFDKRTLAELKNECGGIQTLLRNCNQVFQVSSGQVQLRDFTNEDPFEGKKRKENASKKSDFYKTSICWFYENHPDGCPRRSDTCMYAHGEKELRKKPTRAKRK